MGNKQGGGSSQKLSSKDLVELEKLSSFPKKQIQVWYKTFLEENPSGLLSKEAFIKDNTQQFGLSKECWEYFYNALDKDKNGNIDFKEWLVGMYIHQKGTLDEKLELAFKVYDLDGNGFIDESELLKLAENIHKFVDLGSQHDASHGQTPQERVKYLLSLMDENKDGKISFEEFSKGVKKDKEISEGLRSCVFRVI